ncbi:MAG TPA: ADP-ribose pyrophosphatase, partial [Ruminococcaceae bacterium]|nr:ADP-ribose pyrophosphatase [Oscillospiraceae bacterium]
LEYGEDPFEAGKRELREETGAVAEHYIDLGKFYPTPGYCGEIIHMYAAKGLSFTSLDLDDDEFLAPEKIPLEKAVEMVMNNEIRDGKTQTAVLKVAQKRRKGEI